jgi:radical SAM protein with 4Fe4S-binding SPASM domain
MLNNQYYSRIRLSNYNSKDILTVLDRNGEIFTGNFSFYEVWSKLDGKTSVSKIIENIKNQFHESDSIEIENDVLNIIDEMLKHGLIDKGNIKVPVINKIENKLLSAHVAITSYCNLQCKHCYLNQKNNCFISLEEFNILLKDLTDLGILTIEIGGGEPLMHKDFYKFIEIAKNYGFYLRLFTNGILINSNNIDHIKKNINSFRISLDGNQETHDFRRGKNSFASTLEALKLLKNCDVQISMTVDDNNFNDISIVKEISKKLNFKFEVSPVVPYSHIQFTHDKLNLILSKINESFSVKERKNKRADFRGPNCEAANRLIYIDSEFNLTPCPLLNQKEWHIGSLKNKSINELLTSDNYKKIATSLNKLKQRCNNCNKCQFWCAAIINSTPNRLLPFCLRNDNEN